jgi:hypothetical protein
MGHLPFKQRMEGDRVRWTPCRVFRPGRRLLKRETDVEAIERLDDPCESGPTEAVELSALESRDDRLVDAGEVFEVALRHAALLPAASYQTTEEGEAAKHPPIGRPHAQIPAHPKTVTMVTSSAMTDRLPATHRRLCDAVHMRHAGKVFGVGDVFAGEGARGPDRRFRGSVERMMTMIQAGA